MPLCGTKKSKKQKRDRSPPYKPQEAERLTEEKSPLEIELGEEKRGRERERAEGKQKDAEIAELKKTIDALKKKVAEKKDATDGVGMSVLTSVSSGAEEELKNTKQRLEEEAKQREAAAEEHLKAKAEFNANIQKLEKTKSELEQAKKRVEDELKVAQKSLETERTHRLKIEEEREKLKREKDSVDNSLAHTKKELEIAKKESHIPRSPTKAPSDEWKARIETAESDLQKERNIRIEKEKEFARLMSEKDQLREENEQLQGMIKSSSEIIASDTRSKQDDMEMNYKNNVKKLEESISDLKSSLKQKETDNETLLNRLSTLTAAQVLDNNPYVADLSDPSRPQRLSEKMADLYDELWSEASDALESLNITEDDVPKTLLKILTSVYNHCKESAENQMSRIEEDIFLPPLESPIYHSPENGTTELLKSPTSSKHSMSKIPRFTSHKGRPALPNLSTEKKTVDVETNDKDKDKSKRSLSLTKVKGEKLPELPVEVKQGIKEYRKKVTKQVIPVIEKEVTNKLRNDPDVGDKIVDACKAYISRCVELCWQMRVQDPPVCLSWKVPEDMSFPEDTFRAFTRVGSHVDFVVWPAMYLYDGGPILAKGVAQGAS